MKKNFEQWIIRVDETDSTNLHLRRIAETEQLGSGSILVADFQTAGRGQAGNSWESEVGKNLTFSVLFYPTDVPAGRFFVIAQMAALSMKNTLDPYISDVCVKWPNDVYCGDRKIAGILIENTIFQGKITQSIIGIGLNVNQTFFHFESADSPQPTSLKQITGCSYDRWAILDDFQRTFTEQAERLNKGFLDAVHTDYIDTLYHKNGYHLYRDEQGEFEATFHDIALSGHLVLERRDGHLSHYDFKTVRQVIRFSRENHSR